MKHLEELAPISRSQDAKLFYQWSYLVLGQGRTSIVNPYGTVEALRLLYRHIPYIRATTSPRRVMVLILAAYIAERGRADFGDWAVPPDLESVLATRNPVIETGIDSLRGAVQSVRLHSVSKLKGDLFFDRMVVLADVEKSRASTWSRLGERNLIVKLLMVFMSRSDVLLLFFRTRPMNMSDTNVLVAIYDYMLARGSAYPGRKNTKWKHLTSEQKSLGIGAHVDRVLWEFWADPSCFDEPIGGDYEVLKRFTGLRGSLTFLMRASIWPACASAQRYSHVTIPCRSRVTLGRTANIF